MERPLPKCKGIHTNQDAFNKVWNHFITHRHGPALNSCGECITYDPKRPHARCAYGIMATPRECQAELEWRNDYFGVKSNMLFSTLAIETVLKNRGIDIGWQLQYCHDEAASVSAASVPKEPGSTFSFIEIMRTKLTELANQNGLQIPA